ncbi:hypothetical protein [Tenacibaculum ovolyticum]|uniref:hypothetical protein n=1 Tax=Tenacibaculum ovolyticum TaxID=104270 RepID=UPI001F4157CF|nr:hypothetical protein [Tenacibaculum ovolyticum]
MSAYLDNNILIEIEENKYSIEKIKNQLNIEFEISFYSQAHIYEAIEMKTSNEQLDFKNLSRRFDEISSITNNMYLMFDIKNNRVCKKKIEPKLIFDTISDAGYVLSMIKSFVNLIENEKKVEFRKENNLDSKRINNLKPYEVIMHLEKKTNIFQGESFMDQLLKIYDNKLLTKEQRNLYCTTITFEFLDLIGYWKDKVNSKSNYARLWDSNHAFFASFCQFFISNDFRTRNKTKVVYELLGVNTVIHSMS